MMSSVYSVTDVTPTELQRHEIWRRSPGILSVLAMPGATGMSMEEIRAKIFNDPDLTERQAWSLIMQSLPMSTSEQEARAIMATGKDAERFGGSVIGPREVLTYADCRGSSEILGSSRLRSIPYPPQTLEACKDSHILIALLPCQIGYIAPNGALGRIKNAHSKRPRNETPQFFDQGIYYLDYDFDMWIEASPEESGAMGRVYDLNQDPFGWYLVRRNPHPDTYGLPWADQQNVLVRQRVLDNFHEVSCGFGLGLYTLIMRLLLQIAAAVYYPRIWLNKGVRMKSLTSFSLNEPVGQMPHNTPAYVTLNAKGNLGMDISKKACFEGKAVANEGLLTRVVWDPVLSGPY